MAPVGKNGKDTNTPNPWGWVEQTAASTNPDTATITIKELLRVYRVQGYRECPFARKRQCKCKKNPHCLWGLGDLLWRTGECIKEEQSQIREEGQIAGLLNQGQTCYVNSLLQLWYHNPILRPAILSWEPPYGVTTDADTLYSPVCAVGHLQMMFARMKASKQRTIDTVSFVSALGLDPGQQQDAEEFAKLLLTCVTQLLDSSPQNTGISRVFKTCFTGESQFQTTCASCHNVTVGRTEEFNELQLSVSSTLEESFLHYFSEERLEKDNQYFCNNCWSKQDAIRKVRLLKLPQVLNIQLMRFVFDPATMEKKKVMKYMHFPDVLDMSSYLHTSGHEAATGNGDTSNNTKYIYVLNAVLIHHGNRASSGHYTSYIKDPTSGCWIECNDDKVAEINNKSHSKKLVIKTEETGEEVESHSTSGLGSKGAYMLVYTRQEYFSKVEPDPELPKHIAEVIKSEDALVESQQQEQKLAKEEETLKRAQRLAEIMLLYGRKYPPPNPELAEDSNTTLKQSDSDIEIIETKPPATNAPPIDINTIDFISTSWLERWLVFTPLEESLPITNEDIVCQHGNLRPSRKNEMGTLYKIIPSIVAEVLYERYNGHRLSGEAALCTQCVTSHFNYLVDLIRLEDDAKKVNDAVRTCDQELERNGRQYTNVFNSNKFLIGKDSLKDWKKYAKKRIEQREKLESEAAVSDDTEEHWRMNHELSCPHDNLCLSTTAPKRRILYPGYEILSTYFPDGIWYGSGEPECHVCMHQQQNNAAVFEQYKLFASEEKTKLSELSRGLSRPTTMSCGTYSLVPVSFIANWKCFLKTPTTEPPLHIQTMQLLCDTVDCTCESPRLKYPFYALQNDRNHAVEEKDLFEQVVMVRENEIKILLEKRSMDMMVKVTIKEHPTDRRRRIYSHNFDICEQSAWEWINSVVEKRFNYEDDIIIRKCENLEEMMLDSTSNGHDVDSDDVPSKIPRGENDANGHLRRSVRRRPSRNDHKYRIHSSTSIREFQINELCRDYSAGLSDQHVYLNGKELNEETRRRSFAELRIPPGTVLYLVIDKPLTNGNAKGERETTPPKPAQVERGFTGTALLRASFPLPKTVSSPFGSPSAIVHSPSAPPWSPSFSAQPGSPVPQPGSPLPVPGSPVPVPGSPTPSDSDSTVTVLNTAMWEAEVEEMDVDPPDDETITPKLEVSTTD